MDKDVLSEDCLSLAQVGKFSGSRPQFIEKGVSSMKHFKKIDDGQSETNINSFHVLKSTTEPPFFRIFSSIDSKLFARVSYDISGNFPPQAFSASLNP